MKNLLLAAASLCIGSLACADPLDIPQRTANETVVVTRLPQKGQTMQAISREFGTPQLKHAAVGGETPRHPPITRWDYPGFSVFFENTHVVSAVAPDRPPPIYHSEQLQAASR